MKLIRSSLAIVTLALLTACAAGVDRRIQRNPQVYAGMSTEDQKAVRAGRIREGMTKAQVHLSWGRPDEISSGVRHGKQLERWTYSTLRPVFLGPTSRFSMGMGMGGCGIYPGPVGMIGSDVNYIPAPGPTVEFENGIVTGYTVPR